MALSVVTSRDLTHRHSSQSDGFHDVFMVLCKYTMHVVLCIEKHPISKRTKMRIALFVLLQEIMLLYPSLFLWRNI